MLKFLILMMVLGLPAAQAGYCKERKKLISAKVETSNFRDNLRSIRELSKVKLIVLGEPHGTYYLQKLPDILQLLGRPFDCAFIEQPYTLEQQEIDQLIAGKNTEHFQTKASFDYVPFYKHLRAHQVRIIPVDSPFRKATEGNAKWMMDRDDDMYRLIQKEMPYCQMSVFLVGKYHLSPDISAYKRTLGMRLRESMKEQVLMIDMIHRKNYYEDYCTPQQNRLFTEDALFDTKSLEKLNYSTVVSHGYWSDFDYILYLKK